MHELGQWLGRDELGGTVVAGVSNYSRDSSSSSRVGVRTGLTDYKISLEEKKVSIKLFSC